MNETGIFPQTIRPNHHDQPSGRLSAFFDAVYAIIMTILVLGLVYPSGPSPQSIISAIVTIWPQVFHFMLGFFILAAFWRIHHREFQLLIRIDETLIQLTFLLLFVSCLLPFTTSIAGDFSDSASAVSLFHLNIAGIGIIFLAQFIYMNRAGLLQQNDVTYNQGLWRGALVPITALIALIICQFSPDYSSIIYLFLPIIKMVITHKKPCKPLEINISGQKIPTPSELLESENNVKEKENSQVIPVHCSLSLCSKIDATASLMGISREECTLKILKYWEREQKVPLDGTDALCSLS